MRMNILVLLLALDYRLVSVLFQGTLHKGMMLLDHAICWQRKVSIKQCLEAAPGQPRLRVPIGSCWVLLFAFSSGHNGSGFQSPLATLPEANAS